MNLACFLLLAAQSSDFSQAMRLVGEERYIEAHELIETLPSAIDHAQAQVFLRLRAGDLSGALHWSEVGAEAAPDDLWLLERRASIAISLRAHELAVRAVDKFASALERAGTRDDSEALNGLTQELEKMAAAGLQRETAMFRSRTTVFAALTILLGLLFKLTRK